jgi:predicted ATP-grasp superfamily ATP-dependent carboligase
MGSDPIEITDSLPDGSKLFARAAALAQVVTEEFGLVGVNGIDFIANDGVPFPIEVNPRYSASMELVERALGISIFDLHVRGCMGPFSAADAIMPATPDGAFGKAVVYARDIVTLGDTTPWLDDASVRDIPHPGERIGRGRPVCTVFARGDDAVSCYAALVRRAEQVYDAIEAAGAAMIVA